jgi:hypothetical protein
MKVNYLTVGNETDTTICIKEGRTRKMKEVRIATLPSVNPPGLIYDHAQASTILKSINSNKGVQRNILEST